jgi:hypothetical protein
MRNFARGSPFSDLPPTRMFVWPLEMMLRFNASIANAVQESTVTWAQRRQEATRNAAETFERLIRCRDLGEAVSIQQEWIENNIRRLDNDFGVIAEQSASLSHRAASTARDAIGESSRAAQAVTREADETGESMVRESKETEHSRETPRRAAHRMHGESRRAKTRRAGRRAPNKGSGKPHKTRKRRAA